jgi:lipopolysaccharide biosynthesis protein
MSTSLVFAHHHQSGLIRSDTSTLLNALVEHIDEIYFISTNVKDSELKKLDPRITFKVRENDGYDFYSYKTGIDLLSLKNGYDHLTLMNSSFLCSDPQKFIDFYFKQGLKEDFEVIGLTKSWEITEHIQSYLITISGKVLQNKIFLDWWKNMVPLNIREDVILNYEIGLSNLLLKLHKLKSVFKTGPSYNQGILNPTHQYYLNLLKDVGILKIEIIKNNPSNVNLAPINKAIRHDDKFLSLIREGLEN